MNPRIASRYARALGDVLLPSTSGVDPRQVLEQLGAFNALLAESADLRSLLLSPAVPPARKRAVVSRLAERLGMPTLIRNFLYVVIDHRRVDLLREIREAFENLVDERQDVVRADVSSAAELSAAQRDQVAAALSRLGGKLVRCRFSADPELLGGLKAKIGSTIYDGSVRSQLEALRRRLVAD